MQLAGNDHVIDALVSKILLLPLENNIYIFEPLSNVLFIIWTKMKRNSVRTDLFVKNRKVFSFWCFPSRFLRSYSQCAYDRHSPLEIINNTRGGLKIGNAANGGQIQVPEIKSRSDWLIWNSSPMETRIHIRDLNLPPNSRVPFFDWIKITMPPLVLFIISMHSPPDNIQTGGHPGGWMPFISALGTGPWRQPILMTNHCESWRGSGYAFFTLSRDLNTQKLIFLKC
jgi:hypothetical protein